MRSPRKKQRLKKIIGECERQIDFKLTRRQYTVLQTSMPCFKKYILLTVYDKLGLEMSDDLDSFKKGFMFFPTSVAIECECKTDGHYCSEVVSATDFDLLWVDPHMWDLLLEMHDLQLEEFKKTVDHLEQSKCLPPTSSDVDSLFFTLMGSTENCLNLGGRRPNDSLLEMHPDLKKRCSVQCSSVPRMMPLRLETEDGSVMDYIFSDHDNGRHYITWVHPVVRQWSIFHSAMSMGFADTSFDTASEEEQNEPLGLD